MTRAQRARRVRIAFAAALVVCGLLAAVTAARSGNGNAPDALVPVPGAKWPLPRLSSPETIMVSNGHSTVRLDPARDYILRMTEPLRGRGLTIVGGRNVVLRGGEVEVTGIAEPNEANARCLAIFNSKGTVHVEGLWCHGDQLVEGIQSYAPEAILQVVNTRVERVQAADLSSSHPDVIQFGAGRELRVDRLTASTNYQGIFVSRNPGPAERVVLSRVNLRGVGDGRSQLIWFGEPGIKVRLDRVFIAPPRGQPLTHAVWPSSMDPNVVRRASLQGRRVVWRRTPSIVGGVHGGSPPRGDFVPLGRAGLGYLGRVGTPSDTS